MKKLKIVLPILAAAAVWPAAGNAAPMHGVVVARSHGTLLVATPSGAVQAVRGTASVGSRLVGARVVGRAGTAHVHGVVVKREGATTFLSSNRHLLALHNLAPVPGSSVGSVVNATVGVSPSGRLDDENEDTVGQAGGTVQIQATITAVGAGTVTVSVNGQSLTVSLPAGLTLPSSLVGQTVTFSASLGNPGGGDDDQGGDDDGGGGGGDD